PRQLLVVQHGMEVLAHLAAVARDEEVAARLEQPLRIVPRRRHERDAARERLERPDRRDAGKRAHVWTARYVHGDAVPRIFARDVVVRHPTAIAEAGVVHRLYGVARIT